MPLVKKTLRIRCGNKLGGQKELPEILGIYLALATRIDTVNVGITVYLA